MGGDEATFMFARIFLERRITAIFMKNESLAACGGGLKQGAERETCGGEDGERVRVGENVLAVAVKCENLREGVVRERVCLQHKKELVAVTGERHEKMAESGCNGGEIGRVFAHETGGIVLRDERGGRHRPRREARERRERELVERETLFRRKFEDAAVGHAEFTQLREGKNFIGSGELGIIEAENVVESTVRGRDGTENPRIMVRAGLDVLRTEVARANRETGANEGKIESDETGGDGRIRNRRVNNLLGLVDAVFGGMRFHIIPRGGRLKEKKRGLHPEPSEVMKPTLLPCYCILLQRRKF